MYRAVVKRAFMCRVHAKHYYVGKAYISEDPERIKQLQAGGFLAEEVEEEAPPTGNEQIPEGGASLVPGENDQGKQQELAAGGIVSDPGDDAGPNEEHDDVDERLQHVGGGYYLLPNGEKVRGKEKAIEALEALDADAAGVQPAE